MRGERGLSAPRSLRGSLAFGLGSFTAATTCPPVRSIRTPGVGDGGNGNGDGDAGGAAELRDVLDPLMNDALSPLLSRVMMREDCCPRTVGGGLDANASGNVETYAGPTVGS